MKVCIAEKPSVAQTIAAVLGAGERRQGYYEGGGYQVTWTFGHLCELKAPHEYTEAWKSWRMDTLPMIPPRFGITLKDDEGVRRQFGVIESLFRQAECIINCGDAGQEGELIQRWVMQKAGVACPVYRLWISSLTDEAVRDGFRHLELQAKYDRLYAAGLSRAIGDWTLGMNATRAYTLRYAQRDQRQVLSIGRVQTPTLALIVARHFEIVNFQPQQYWELKTLYRDATFSATRGRYEKREDAEAALAAIVGQPFAVTDVQKKSGREAPPRLYDLTSLQVDCNRKFSLSADETLRLIQSLYEKKATTYPRVDTTYLSDDIYPKCPATLQRIAAQADYAALAAPLVSLGAKLPKPKKVFDNSKVTDHHAIIPTPTVPAALSQDERRVYDLVVRRFLAVFYPDCRFDTTQVLGEAAGVPFKATGKVITDPGWRAVYGNQAVPDDEKEAGRKDDEEAPVAVLPAFAVGETGPHEPSLAEKWTQPPKPYTEATLLRAMETAGRLCEDDELRDAMKENGLGRPSTRAAIIETLFKRRYIRKERKSLAATQTGIELIGLIHDDLLKSAELTGQWERKLRQIERGEYEAAQFLDELKQMVAQVVWRVRTDRFSARVALTEESDVAGSKGKKAAAPKDKDKEDGKPSAGTRKPAARRKKKDAAAPASAPTASPAADAPAAATPSPSSPASATPAPYTMTTLPAACPRCGAPLLRGRTAFGCSRYAEGCTFRIPFDSIADLPAAPAAP